MSLSEIEIGKVNLRTIVLMQYLYKLKGSSSLIHSLIFMQLLGLIFSLTPNGSMGAGSDFITVSVNLFSTNLLQIFSMVWMVGITNYFISSNYRRLELPLTHDSLSGHLSNILLILTIAIFAGTTSTLLSIPHRIILLFIYSDSGEFFLDGISISPAALLLGVFVSTLYLLLLAALSYLIRAVIEVNRIFIVILPALFIGLARPYQEFYAAVFNCFTAEPSLALFLLKAFMASAAFFALSFLITRKTEVGK